MAKLDRHWAYLEEAQHAARAAPLSQRKAMLVVMLLDAYVDRLFALAPEADDILRFRAALAESWPTVGLIMALAAGRDEVRLVTEAVVVPLADYGALPVEDFMVSLYNDHSVQRLRIVGPDGGRKDVHETLAEAMAALSR